MRKTKVFKSKSMSDLSLHSCVADIDVASEMSHAVEYAEDDSPKMENEGTQNLSRRESFNVDVTQSDVNDDCDAFENQNESFEDVEDSRTVSRRESFDSSGCLLDCRRRRSRTAGLISRLWCWMRAGMSSL
jgi:hypothetical protein